MHLLLQLIYVGKVAIPLDGYAAFIESAKSLKLEKFVYQDLSLHYNFGSDAAPVFDWDAVGSETATGGASTADDSVEGRLVIDEPDDQVSDGI